MAFFNKKEDVLEIELTQFGKYRLSQGDFNPVYYAFFDDDIIYDAEYAGVTSETGSNQNLIEPRIKEVPRNRVQHVYTGIETQVTRNNRLIRTGEFIDEGQAMFVGKKDPNLKIFEPVNDTNFSSYAPLGTSDLSSDKMPAWSITLYTGKVDSSAIQLTSSATAIGMKIPQLEATINYKTFVSSPEVDAAVAGSSAGGCGETLTGKATVNDTPSAESTDDILQELYQNDSQHVGLTAEIYDEFEDDSYIEVKKDDLLLKIEEFNAPFSNDNFDIEVFELTSSTDVAGNVHEVWSPLYFRVETDQFGNYKGIDDDDYWLSEELNKVDSTYVTYFMNVNTDRDIPEEDLCPALVYEKQSIKDLYDVDLVCPDLDLIRRGRLLGQAAIEDSFESTVKEEDIKECD